MAEVGGGGGGVLESAVGCRCDRVYGIGIVQELVR